MSQKLKAEPSKPIPGVATQFAAAGEVIVTLGAVQDGNGKNLEETFQLGATGVVEVMIQSRRGLQELHRVLGLAQMRLVAMLAQMPEDGAAKPLVQAPSAQEISILKGIG